MTKPGKSQVWLILGLVLQGIGGTIYLGAFANTLKASIFSDTSGSSSGMTVGAILSFVGWLMLLKGISRVSSSIDYLVSMAPSDATAKPTQATPPVPAAPPTPPVSS
jgi:hypothetical protein